MALRDKILLWIGPALFWLYLRFVALTSKITIVGEDIPERVKQTGSGFIYAFWHNRQIILPLLRKQDTIHCLISSSKDGEYVARIAALFGKRAIRGSTTRGGYEAMKEMMRVLRAGGIVAITPDGPLGPVHVVQPGVIQMARAVDAPIIPIAFDASRKKVFASWDGFYLPYPFSRITVVFGEAVRVNRSETEQQECLRLKAALDNAAAGAEKTAD